MPIKQKKNDLVFPSERARNVHGKAAFYVGFLSALIVFLLIFGADLSGKMGRSSIEICKDLPRAVSKNYTIRAPGSCEVHVDPDSILPVQRDRFCQLLCLDHRSFFHPDRSICSNDQALRSPILPCFPGWPADIWQSCAQRFRGQSAPPHPSLTRGHRVRN